MAKITVIATTLGQLPDGAWVKAGDEFEIDASIASHRWMKRADGKAWPTEKPASVSDPSAEVELKALLAAANERAEAAEKLLAEVTAPVKTAKA